MKTWATLAAKHATLTSGIGLGAIPAMGWDSLDGVAVGALLAGIGFAVLNSPGRAQNCELPLMTYERAGQAQASRAPGGRLARVRRRVDGVLTGMLSDDSDRMTPDPATWQNDVPDEQRPDGQRPAAADAEPTTHAERAEYPEPAADAEPMAYAEPMAEADPLADAEPAAAKSDGGFWGPGEPGSAGPTSGYRSKHRLDALAGNATPAQSRRTGPRHAAPPPGFGAALSRSLTSPRLTSRSAAHAGG